MKCPQSRGAEAVANPAICVLLRHFKQTRNKCIASTHTCISACQSGIAPIAHVGRRQHNAEGKLTPAAHTDSGQAVSPELLLSDLSRLIAVVPGLSE